nr:sigma factor [Burkholderia cenocepacia]
MHRLYQDHSPWLLGWLHRRVNDGADAADLLHDTYLRLITSGRLPDSNCPERSRAFLMQIAKGLVIDLHRRRRLERAYLESLAQLPAACVTAREERTAQCGRGVARGNYALACFIFRFLRRLQRQKRPCGRLLIFRAVAF